MDGFLLSASIIALIFFVIFIAYCALVGFIYLVFLCRDAEEARAIRDEPEPNEHD